MTAYWTTTRTHSRPRRSMLDGRYQRVQPTEKEIEVYLASHPGQKSPAVYRLKCLTCGQFIWGSGLGIGSHERGREHNEAEGASR
jgi:hypothetical protein